MTKTMLVSKIKELKEWEARQAEAEAHVEAIKNEIKDEMLRKRSEEYEVGGYIIRYRTVVSDKFDTTKFKEAHADMYREFLKSTSSKRFTISK